MKFLLYIAMTLVLIMHSAGVKADHGIGEINVYSSSKEHLIRPILQRFKAATGIEVNLTTVPRASLTSRLKLEGKDTPADVVIVADIANLYALQEKNLLHAEESDILKVNIPDNLRDDQHRWFGITQRARILFARKDDLEAQKIVDYRDLAKPAWKNSILVRSSDSVYNQSLLADLIYRHGKEEALAWARGVVENMARKPSGGDRDQLRALASGQGRVAIANSYYYALMLTGDSVEDRKLAEKLVPVFPTANKGPHLNIRGVAITKYSKHKAFAKRLLDYLSEPNAQHYLALTNYEYPVHRKTKAAGVLEQWKYTPNPEVPLYKIGQYNRDAVEIFSQAGWQ